MELPEAAVAILHAQLPVETVLLIRRAEREGDPWSGHWSFPGGRRDPTDSNLLFTALRELDEECGIRLDEKNLETALRPTMAGRKAGKLMLVAPFLFRIDRPLPTLLDTREAVEAVWMPLSRIQDLAEHRLQNVPGMAPEMHFPAIELNGMALWGFTYRVLCEWLGLGPVPPETSAVGSRTAQELLDFLLSEGLTLEQGWSQRGSAKIARVRGRIPVSSVLDRFSLPSSGVPPVNFLEVKSGHIHLAGPAFDEYFIYSSDAGAD
jgi:8-oxo-dGTP pyrophosphatase MutT (NUDIX family)